MFSQFTKPYFGVTPSTASFGFANSATSSQMSVSSQPFGQSTGFASAPQQNAFGAPSQKPEFVTLFDQKNAMNPSPFSQQPGFSFGTSSKPPLTQPFAQPPANLFCQKPASPFGSFGIPAKQVGTVTKYEPVTGMESILRSGIASTICTKLYCITCMKDYESKSLEELRWEDYQEGRKRPQPVPFSYGQISKPAFSFGMNTANQQATFCKTPGFSSAPIVKPFSAPPTQNFFTPTTSNTPTAQPFRFGTNFFGQTTTSKPNTDFFSTVKQTIPSTQPGVFAFAQQPPKPSNTFEPSSFKMNLNSFATKSAPFSSFLQTTNQQPIAQPFQHRFATANPPLFSFTTQTSATSAPTAQFDLPTGQEFESQLHDFHNTVQQIFQPFPRREFLRTPKRSTVQARDPKVSRELVEKLVAPPGASRLQAVPKSRRGRYALLDDLVGETPQPSFGRRATGRCLMLGKNKQESEKAKPGQVRSRDLSDSDSDMGGLEWKSAEAFLLKDGSFKVGWQQELQLQQERNRLPEHKWQKTLFTKRVQLSPLHMNTIGTQTAEGVSEPEQTSKTSASFESTQNLPELAAPEGLFSDQTNTPPTHEDETPVKPSLFAEGDCRPSNLCGIKLERPDYYTVPPLEELYNHRDELGRCLIKDFKIGKIGYGEIHFLDEVNVSNLDLDDIVDFQYREVTVYPDDARKPPIGQGLNQRAQVTLHQIWPLDKKTDTRLKDPRDLAEVGFAARLSLLSERQNATFVDYRPETGSWVFMVEHFSKYHFDDSEDEDAAQLLEEKQPVQHEAGDGRAVVLKRDLEKETAERTSKKAQGEGDEGSLETRLDDTQTTVRLTKVASLGANSAIMKSSLFGASKSNEKESHRRSKATLIATKARKKSKATIMHFPLLNRHEAPTVSLLTPRNYTDASLLRSKCFKVGWGHGFKFTASTNTAKLTLLRLEITAAADIEKQMEICYRTCTITAGNGKAPLCAVNTGWEPLLKHEGSSTGLDKQIWDLCLAFWGPLASTPVARRVQFSNWLQKAAHPYVQTELKPHSFSNLFAYLSGHKIEEAAHEAMELGFPRLATLVASSQQSVRELLGCQVQQWQDSGAINSINRDVLELYMLLGGIPVLSDVNICKDLDWKRALAVHLWYICPNGVSLIQAIEAYQTGFKDLNYAAPPYVNHSNNSVYDILFHIMQLYAHQGTPIDKALDPLTHTNQPLDYRMSWLLLQVLTALKVGIVPPHVANSIHTSFASQLEGMGLWKWAIFVLLFLKDVSAKTHMIMGILERNLDLNRMCKHNLAIEDSLVNDFKIPRAWIHAVLAQKTHFYQRHIETFGHLICSSKWLEAHAVALSHLVPDWMAAREYNHLLVLFDNLALAGSSISGWNHGGGLVLDILSLHLGGSCGDRCLNVAHMNAKLKSLCLRMKHFPSASPMQAWAAAELSKLVADLLRSFCNNLQHCALSDVQSFVADILLLPMPPEYKFTELHNASRCLTA